MREQSGARRRTTQCPRKCHGRILHADRGLQQLQAVDNVGGAVLVPDPSRRADAFGFTGDQRALPRGERKNPRMAEAAESCDAAPQLVRTLRQRQRFLDQLARFVGKLRCVGRALLQLVPELDWIAQAARREKAQARVVFGEDEGLAAVGDGIAIALFDGVGGFAARHLAGGRCRSRDTRSSRGERDRVCTRAGKASSRSLTPQIRRPSVSRQVPKFSMWRSPTPRTAGSLGELLASFRPVLKPAIEGGAEEGERILRHQRMFERDVLADDGEALGQPLLEVRGGFEDVHGAFCWLSYFAVSRSKAFVRPCFLGARILQSC